MKLPNPRKIPYVLILATIGLGYVIFTTTYDKDVPDAIELSRPKVKEGSVDAAGIKKPTHFGIEFSGSSRSSQPDTLLENASEEEQQKILEKNRERMHQAEVSATEAAAKYVPPPTAAPLEDERGRLAREQKKAQAKEDTPQAEERDEPEVMPFPAPAEHKSTETAPAEQDSFNKTEGFDTKWLEKGKPRKKAR